MTGEQIIDLLIGLHDERALTIVLATHDPLTAGRCDRVMHVRDGLIADDPSATKSAQPTA